VHYSAIDNGILRGLLWLGFHSPEESLENGSF
jgi:hypothetical protein